MAGHTGSDHHPRWPKDVCHRCGETIQFVRVKGTSRWLAYDAHPFARHHCGDALDVALHFNDPNERRVIEAARKRH